MVKPAKKSSELDKLRKKKSERNAVMSKDDVINVAWTLNEKRKLLKGLREYGCDNLTKLQQIVRTKSEAHINYFIDRRRSLATRRVDEPVEPAIEMWIGRATKSLAQKHDYSKAVTEGLARCAENTSDYGEVYRFLLRLFRNEPTPDLDVESNAVMVRLLKDFYGVLKTLPVPQIKMWFDKLDFTLPLTEEGNAELFKKSNATVKTSLYFGHGPLVDGMGRSFNPLRIPPQILQFVDNSIRK